MPTKEDAGPVRALEPSAPYFSRLSARSALYTDLHVLMDRTCEPLTASAYRSLVIDANCVARKSAAATLQRESGLVSQVIEVIGDLEDEGIDPTGSLLLDTRDSSSGFKGFERPPFGWPGEIVRPVLAARFRAGAIHLGAADEHGAEPDPGVRGPNGRLHQDHRVQEDDLPGRRDQPERRSDPAGVTVVVK